MTYAIPSNPKDLAGMVDHTLLKPEATTKDVDALIKEAIDLGAWSVCVSPTFVEHARQKANGQVKVCTVVGFPSGKVKSSIKAAEAAQAVEDGAEEVDMVIDVGKAKENDFQAVENDIKAVRAAIPNTLLKVIIESAALTDDEIVQASQAAKNAQADFVKTSTGFHPSGGATPHAIALMRQTVGDDLGVKASGGVRTLTDAEAVIKAGASRLGLSGTKAVLSGYDGYQPEPTGGGY